MDNQTTPDIQYDDTLTYLIASSFNGYKSANEILSGLSREQLETKTYPNKIGIYQPFIRGIWQNTSLKKRLINDLFYVNSSSLRLKELSEHEMISQFDDHIVKFSPIAIRLIKVTVNSVKKLDSKIVIDDTAY